MPNPITIDGVEYDLDTLTEAAKTLVGQLQEISNHLAYLQSQAGIANIAYNQLANQLKAELQVD